MPRAYAVPSVDEAQEALSEAEAHMEAVTAEYAQLKAEYDALQAQIDKAVAQAMEAQKKVIAGRNDLGTLANYEYRGGSLGILDMVLSSEDFRELLRNLEYLASIQQYQADIIAEQKARVAEYQALLKLLNEKRDEQDKKLVELEAKQAEAQAIVDEAKNTLADAQAEEARLEALALAAASMYNAYSDPGIYDGWNTNPGAGDEGSGDVAEPGSTGWFTGYASAYGGESDPTTPNPGITATGAVCDDWSMGVAVPMAWKNYRQYFGRTVEINYNGMTVIATVNDCGYMGAGSRSLDLQPGVWKAFGFDNCYAWGVRMVSYRFL
ncbi:MAG: hypothetical protein IJJ32_04945 [Eggerthellaceae bacterium]|nr:hypothetical protein [Eggerthellaceae bacterium]